MAAEFSITGSDQLVALSKALKGLDVTTRKEFHRDLGNAIRPMIPEARQHIAQTFPQAGGLAASMAKSRITPTLKTGQKVAGLTFTFKGLTLKMAENYGRMRHPVYGRPGKTRKEWTWVNQVLPVQDGLFTFCRTRIQHYTPAVNTAFRNAVKRALNG